MIFNHHQSTRYFLVIIFLIFTLSFFSGCGEKSKEMINKAVEETTGIGALKKKKAADKDIAIVKAKAIFTQKVVAGVDLTEGPCLDNNLIPDWVFDIVHNPRQGIDDFSKNQCQAYLDGTAHHFVEMDPDGNLIRAQ